MLNAIATAAGLFGLWFALAPAQASATSGAVAAGAVVASMLIAARFGAFDKSARFSPTLLALLVRRMARSVRGAIGVVGAVIAPTSQRSGLVRIRQSETSEATRAAFANFVGAAPGVTVLEVQADGLLVHALDEEGLDAGKLARTEAALIVALEGKAP